MCALVYNPLGVFNINHITPGAGEGVMYFRGAGIGSQRGLLEWFVFHILTHSLINILNNLLFFSALSVAL